MPNNKPRTEQVIDTAIPTILPVPRLLELEAFAVPTEAPICQQVSYFKRILRLFYLLRVTMLLGRWLLLE